ncbi:MAG: hypothetical protein ABI579_09150 [Candidatus Sumerlaeota bacterium]
MKRIFASLAFSLLLSSFASADMLGLADSPDRYSITRQSIDIPSAASSMATVESGDRVRSNKAPVKVETTSGNTVLVGEDSDATILSENSAQLNRGVVVMTVPGDVSNSTLSSTGLSVSPIAPLGAQAEATAENDGLVAMRKVSDDEIIVGADRRAFAVKDEVTGDQVAMVGPGESMRFLKSAKGWSVLPFGTTKSDSGTDSIVTAQANGSSDNSGDNKEGDASTEAKPRRAAPLILLGIGGAAVAGGLGYAGYKIYDNNKDDNNNNDNNDRSDSNNNDDNNNNDDEGSRGESSPIIPHLPPGHHLPHGHHLPVHHVPVFHHHAPAHHPVTHHNVTEHHASDDHTEGGATN